jgi:hypothetical protein
MTQGHSQGSKDSKLIWENYLAASGLWSPTGDNLIEHDCATHVHHEMYGNGECLREQHHLDETGNVDWYTVQFEHGVEQIPTSNLTVLQFEKHSHGSMKKNEATRGIEEDGAVVTVNPPSQGGPELDDPENPDDPEDPGDSGSGSAKRLGDPDPDAKWSVGQGTKKESARRRNKGKSLEEIATATVGGKKFASHSRDPKAPKAGTRLNDDVKMAGGSSGVTGGWEQREDPSRFRKIK